MGPSAREAEFYEALGDGRDVRCLLCPHQCIIREGRAGFCRVRRNVEGRLTAVGYGRCSSCAVDPIEKKPLYHFYPGSYILSVGTVGCNLGCRFCQNWQIAHTDAPTEDLSPAQLVRMAEEERAADRRMIGIAYTYSEPVVWFEYVLDAAKAARERELKNVLVTNGFISPDPLRGILPLVDAINVDVKSFRNEYYQSVCSGALEPVLRTVEEAFRSGCHVEVTTLVVPGLNDTDEEMEDLSRWLASVGRGVPLHLSRYFPNYRMTLPPTPIETLRRLRGVAARNLDYVYTGNVFDQGGQHTACPSCGRILLERSGLSLRRSFLSDHACPGCGRGADVAGEVFA